MLHHNWLIQVYREAIACQKSRFFNFACDDRTLTHCLPPSTTPTSSLGTMFLLLTDLLMIVVLWNFQWYRNIENANSDSTKHNFINF